jgi:uncharacterized membrane protein
MAEHAQPFEEKSVLLSERFHPPLSMTALQNKWLWLSMGAFTAALSLPFFWVGAWPVVGFLGLDVLLLYGAFRLYQRRAKSTHDDLIITPHEMVLRQNRPSRARLEHRLNPRWVSVDIAQEEDEDVERITLKCKGENMPLAPFLTRPEKTALSKRLKAALARARSF